MMKRKLATVVAAGLMLSALVLPHRVSAQSQPLTINTTGLSCSNGVCDLGSGNVGTFLNLSISSSGGSGPTPFTWRVVTGKLPAGLRMAKFFGVESTEITGTPTKVETSTFTAQVADGAGDTAQQAFTLTINPPRALVITSGCIVLRASHASLATPFTSRRTPSSISPPRSDRTWPRTSISG
jgi:Putative Ig domain